MIPFFIDALSVIVFSLGLFLVLSILNYIDSKARHSSMDLSPLLVPSFFISSGLLLAFMVHGFHEHKWVDVTNKLCYSSEMFSEEKTCKVYTEDPFRDSTRSVTQRTWSWKEETFKGVTIFKRIKTGFGMEYSNDLEPDLKIIPLEVPYER